MPRYLPRTGAMLTPRLRLVRPVNDGRGANVWLADHLALAARVEVTFAEVRASDAAAARRELSASAQAFRDRGEAAARINDPHVVRFLEQGEASGVPFVVTKLLEGKSWRRRLLHGPAALPEVLRVVRDVAGALGKAHSLGIAHGELRPDCLFSTEVAGEEFLEIAGFGGSAAGDGEPGSIESPYASPEQLLYGTASDVRSDLWSFAVTVYELLTTTLPFEAPTPAGVTVAICNASFARPSHYRADLPRGIDGWFEAALAKDPAHRFRDAAEFASAFELAVSADVRPEVVAPPLPDTSLEMDDDDDDGDEDEKTVKWDMPDDARAIARSSLPQVAPPASFPPVSLPLGPGSPSHPPPSAGSPNLAMVYRPGPVSAPPRPLASAARPATLPPALEPGVYLESPYIASVMSALAVPAPAANAVTGAPLPLRQRLFGVDAPLFTPDKTWLAALAFAAGVAVTWFAYEPKPEGEPVTLAEPDGQIRTLSVDDLPRVEGDDVENLRIMRPSQLPRANDEPERVAPPPRAPVASERRAAPAPKTQSPAPSASKASAAPRPAAKPAEVAANCNPPYYFDTQGIRRLKSECLNGTGVIQGPYGAVITTNVSAKSGPASSGSSGASKASSKGASGKSASSNEACTPPYYFDGKIRRLKLECL